jgi:hypothetical protein
LEYSRYLRGSEACFVIDREWEERAGRYHSGLVLPVLMIALLALAAFAEAITPTALLDRVEATRSHRSEREAAAVPTIDDSVYEKVAAGKIVTGVESVDGYSAKTAWGVGILHMSVSRAEAVINDELQHPGYTALSWNELISGKPCESGRMVLQYMDVPIVWDRWWLTTIRDNATIRESSGGEVREVFWESNVDASRVTSEEGKARIEKGVPIEFSKGGWLLIELSETETLLEYHVWTDPGGRLPAGPASSFAAGGITDMYGALERFDREVGTRCKR